MKDGTTALSAQEFRDSLLLWYGRTPPNLPSCCDGCGQKFSVRHALECPHGGLIIGRHNEVRDELGEIAAVAFAPNAIRSLRVSSVLSRLVAVSNSSINVMVKQLNKQQYKWAAEQKCSALFVCTEMEATL